MDLNLDLESETPPTFHDFYLNNDRYLILKGSAGSGKSVFVTKKVVYRAFTEDGHKFLMTRKIHKTLKDSLYEEIRKRIIEWGLKNRLYYYENKSELKIWLHNSEFIFMGMDDPEKLKSIEGITSAVCEEMTELNEDDFDQINLRIRGITPYYKQTIGMFNPISEDHWVKRRFVENPPRNISLTFHESTYKDNPFLDQEYKDLLESYKDTNELYYQVYCLGDWGIVDTSGKFLYNFRKDHVGECGKSDGPIKLSFDFNLEPFAVVIYQNIGPSGLKFFDKIRLENSDIYQVCDMIKANYPTDFYIVTGDRSGWNRTGTIRGKTSYWKIVKKELRLNEAQMKIRSKNIDHVESRILCNSALKGKNIIIDPVLTELISDCTYAKVDERGELEKITVKLVKDRGKHKNDFLDCFRYALDAEWPSLTQRPK